MNRTALMGPRISDVKQAISAIAASLGDHVEEIQLTRRLPDQVVAALRASGINRLLLPLDLGGLQAPTHDVMDVVEALAAVDGSTAWCAAIGAGSNVFAGYMNESGARTVFADPDQGSATMFSPGGRIELAESRGPLTGRWPFASNCLHSAWAGLGAEVERGGKVDPAPTIAFVRVSDLTIEDTWDTAGLRGSGSHHVSADHVDVELDHCCTWADTPWPEGALWRLPLPTVLPPMLVAVSLGIARGALDEIARLVRDGRVARRGTIADDPVSLDEYAAADSSLRAARAALRDVLHEAHELADVGDPVGRPLRARIWLACLHATDVSVEVTSTAQGIGGGPAAYRSSPLLRALCDVQAGRQHYFFAHKHRSELGKILAGLDVSYPPFIP